MAPTMQATAQPIKLGPLPPTNINSQRQGGSITRPGTASASSMYSHGKFKSYILRHHIEESIN